MSIVEAFAHGVSFDDLIAHISFGLSGVTTKSDFFGICIWMSGWMASEV